MNGVGRLIKNELIKVTHQISWKIITALVLVLAIAVPIINYYSETNINSDPANWIRESRDSAEGIIKEYYDAHLRAYDFFENNDISSSDWRYDKFIGEYEDAELSLAGMELVLSGEDPAEVYSVFGSFGDCYYDYGKKTMVYYDENTGSERTIDQAKMTALCDEMRKKIADLEHEVTTITFDDFVNEIVDGITADIGDGMYRTGTDSKALEGVNKMLDIWKAALGTSREDEAWVLKTASASEDIAVYFSSFVPVSESDFESNGSLVSEYKTYAAYKKYCDTSYDEALGAMNTLLYSIKNKIPLPDYMEYSVRDEFRSSVSTNASLTLFFCMILAATIVASEHTSGTIRLLMIRPRARWKILFSKLACIAIYGIAMFVCATGLSFITSAVMHGVSEFSVPYLVLKGTNVAAVSPFAAIFLKVFIDTLPMIVLVMLAFGLSVLMKKVVFAVAIPLMIQMFGSVASEISWMLLGKAPILKWTIIPYYNLSMINYTPFERFSGYGMYDMIRANDLTLKVGIIMMAIHIVAALIISFVAWDRQQIKN